MEARVELVRENEPDRDVRMLRAQDEFDDIPMAIQHFFLDHNPDQLRRRDARERRDRERNARLADRNRNDEHILRGGRDLQVVQREIRGDIAQGRRNVNRVRQRPRRREVLRDLEVPDFTPRVVGKCEMCNASPQMQNFMKHFHDCPKKDTSSRKLKSMILHKYASCDYVLLRRLKKLRYDLEKNYYQAHLELTELSELECSRCASFEEHMNGACKQDNQSAVFEVKSAQIRSSIMAHFEQFLEFKKEIGLDEILDKHNAHFETIEECFQDQPDDIETENRRQLMWYEFRRTTINEQVAEKRNYLRTTEARNRATFEMKLREVDDVIHSMASRISTTITNNKLIRNQVNLRDMVRDARRQVAQVLSIDERRDVHNRRVANRRAQQEMAEQVGLAPMIHQIAVAARPPPEGHGPAEDHDIMAAELRDVMLQFEDSDEEVEVPILNN